MSDVYYHIPGFNGYQINNEGLVRSMKFHYACPEGYILKAHGRGENKWFELTDDNNDRVKITVKQIWELIRNNNNYNCTEEKVYLGSRNKITTKAKPIIRNEIVKPNFSSFIEEEPLMQAITFL